jgi:hypothetical protein
MLTKNLNDKFLATIKIGFLFFNIDNQYFSLIQFVSFILRNSKLFVKLKR